MAGRTEHFYDGYFHGTPHADSADSIVSGGFDLSRAGSNGSDYGHGIYVTRDKGHAAEYAFGLNGMSEHSEEEDVESAEQGRIIPVTLKPERPYFNSLSQSLQHHPVHIQAAATRMAEKANKEGKRGGVWSHKPDDFISEAIQSHGHDAWVDPYSKGMAVAYKPGVAEVAGDPINYEKYHGRTARQDWEDARGGW